MKQAIRGKRKTEDVEVALEICKREYLTRLAEHRSRNAIPEDNIDTWNKEASESNSTSKETRLVAETTHDSNTTPSDNQGERNDRDDIDTIFDAYFDDDRNVESVTDGIASMYE